MEEKEQKKKEEAKEKERRKVAREKKREEREALQAERAAKKAKLQRSKSAAKGIAMQLIDYVILTLSEKVLSLERGILLQYTSLRH